MTLSRSSLEREARLYSRYLIDREPSREMVERYVRAHEALHLDPVSPSDARLAAFAAAHPASIPFLDAAAGWLRADALLRKKIYAMAAILEASPVFARDFLPEYRAPAALISLMVWAGTTAGLKALLGFPLLWLAGRTGRV